MAKDKDHYLVKEALVKDGWVITHDPFFITTPGVPYEADLGAEKLLAATKGKKRIVIEIKTFQKASKVYEFHLVVGQFHNYKIGIAEIEPDRTLYIAMPEEAYSELFQYPIIQKSAEAIGLNLIIYDPEKIEIIKWIKK